MADKLKAFIIHLERAQARRPHVEWLKQELPNLAHLDAAGGAEILAAIDAQKLSKTDIDAVYEPKIFRPHYPFALKPAEIACFLSHRQAWAAMPEQNCEAAFITEDDMQPQANFAEAFALARKNIGQYGFIRFPHRDRERGAVLAEGGGTQLIRPQIIGLGAVAYMLSRAAAQKLLTASARFDRPLDVLLQMFWITGIRPAALRPGGIAEISAQIGGSTLANKADLGQKLRHEILRPYYRAQIALLSRLRSRNAPLGESRRQK